MKASKIIVGQRIIVHRRIATIERVMILRLGDLRIYHSRGQFKCRPDDMILIWTN